jgi:hypothetical protein
MYVLMHHRLPGLILEFFGNLEFFNSVEKQIIQNNTIFNL